MAVESAHGLLLCLSCIYITKENTNDGVQFYRLTTFAFDAHDFTLHL